MMMDGQRQGSIADICDALAISSLNHARLTTHVELVLFRAYIPSVTRLVGDD